MAELQNCKTDTEGLRQFLAVGSFSVSPPPSSAGSLKFHLVFACGTLICFHQFLDEVSLMTLG